MVIEKSTRETKKVIRINKKHQIFNRFDQLIINI